MIRYTVTDCPLGRLLVAWTERGVCAVSLGDDDAALEAKLRRRYADQRIERAHGRGCAWLNPIKSYLEGDRPPVDVPLDVRGTPFQQQVWKALQAIPCGETRTYRDIAVALGKPNAARAIGQACGRNPVALIVPCHRVVGSGGLGGFGLGLERKRLLLEREAASVPS
jgi:AraC family transcriptional regulator, regulatory protein of adaptative response / methylated-DNA-[protein]-cysteine methyltransferase